jgi:SAM-dependent methyltransferase
VAHSSAKEKWLAYLEDALRDGTFVKLTLGGCRDRGSGLKSISARPVELKEGPRLSFVYRHANRDVTRNWPTDEAIALLDDLVGAQFRHAHLFTTRATLELEFREGRPVRLIQSAPVHDKPAATAHDQSRRRLVDPCSCWLRALGVTDGEGRVAKGMEGKFRQINKFVEVLEHLMTDAPSLTKVGQASSLSRSQTQATASKERDRLEACPALTVVDMGCGKGYLTFATSDWLQRDGWEHARVRGIEARGELVDLCNRVAKDNRFTHLHFEAGTIADASLEHADVLIALHACDTATDDAIAKGVRAGASLIIVSPCCHKEVRPQLKPPPVLAGALRHGILLERHAEFVTDALRAALLEWAGYDTKVFEFVSTEHTARNLMIAATKRRQAADLEARAETVRALAAFHGIRQQRLATSLGFAFTSA